MDLEKTMLGWGKGKAHKEITPAALHKMLSEGSVVLVDVREPGEYAGERIAGAINLPLSTFDPAQVPHPGDKTVVLQCAGGKRSGMALDKCVSAQSVIDTHLAGGIGAWKAAGLPVQRG